MGLEMSSFLRLFGAVALGGMTCMMSVVATELPQFVKSSEELAKPSQEGMIEEYVLPEDAHIIVDENYEESLEDPLDPPNDEDTTNIEEDYTENTNLQVPMDVNKVLYNPNMNYGKGAPIPKPEPESTVKRNLLVMAASILFATLAVGIVSTNKGRDAS